MNTARSHNKWNVLFSLLLVQGKIHKQNTHTQKTLPATNVLYIQLRQKHFSNVSVKTNLIYKMIM